MITRIKPRDDDPTFVDEVVGDGRYHLEQMDDNHYWLGLETDTHVHLMAGFKDPLSLRDLDMLDTVAELLATGSNAQRVVAKAAAALRAGTELVVTVDREPGHAEPT